MVNDSDPVDCFEKRQKNSCESEMNPQKGNNELKLAGEDVIVHFGDGVQFSGRTFG